MKHISNKNKLKRIFKTISEIIRPPKPMLPSEWVENNIVATDGIKAGSLITLHAFQRGMMDAITEDKRKVVFKTSAQLGKTMILNGIIFHRIANDPTNIGVAQSNVRELGQWVSGKIKPVLDATPALKAMITDKNDRNSVNNASQIQMKNGSFLYFMSLNSPSHLRGKTIPLIILDEVDAADESDEGSPIQLAEQRASTFGDEARIVIASTPTARDGAINQQWELSDKRRYYVPCQHCGHKHVIVWENVHFEWYQINGKSLPNPDTAVYRCPSCQTDWTEGDRLRAIANGEWIATEPHAEVIGFHANRLMSPFSTIRACVVDFADSYANMSLSTFYNTVLGETFDDLNEDRSANELEVLKAGISLDNIPDDVVALVAGVDQQRDRLECTLLGMSRKGLSVIDHRSFYDLNCERHDSPAYDQLLNFLQAKFYTQSGERIPMLAAFVDSSNGRATNVIYRFCTRWQNLHAIKGASNADAPILPTKDTKTGGFVLKMLGVNNLKTMIREMINRNLKDGDAHTIFQIGDVPDDYCEQLLSEQLKRQGNTTRWVKVGQTRNEALDCLAYAFAASRWVLTKMSWDKLFAIKTGLNREQEDAVETPESNQEEILEESKPITRPQRNTLIQRPARGRRGSWIKSF
ncbi:phage terminase large subunit family protein [Salmonella enterica]|nr:phage terminase large subunit family protein [Salmonella enterica]